MTTPTLAERLAEHPFFHNHEARFWARVVKSDGCWRWTGATGRRGYGIFNVLGKKTRPHRYSWELHFEPIPAGLMVCHHCDNPPCVRPDHLFLGTARDNLVDCFAKGRRVIHRPAHCKRGHEFTPENTAIDRGRRRCRACARVLAVASQARIRAKQRAALEPTS